MFKLNQPIIKNKVLTWSRDLTSVPPRPGGTGAAAKGRPWGFLRTVILRGEVVGQLNQTVQLSSVTQLAAGTDPRGNCKTR